MKFLNSNKFFARYLPMALSVLLIVVGVLTYLTFHSSTPQAQAAWYSSSWNYRKLLVIDHTKVSTASSTTLSNFPVLFSKTDASLATVANGGGVGNADGSDILFTLGDGVTKLSHEIESYSSSTGAVVAWIKIPTLSPTVDTTIYIYYGNAGASNQQNVNGVWDSNYEAVYHLPNGTTLTANDSTTNANNGTLHGAPTATPGQIGGAASFNSASSQYISAASSASLRNANVTVSAWAYWTGSGKQALVSEDDGVSNRNWEIDTGSGGTVWRFYTFNGSTLSSAQSAGAPATNTWVYVTGTYDGTNTKLYVNGSLLTTAAGASLNTTSPSLTIGQGQGTSYWGGNIDEVEYSSTARSPDWIITEYNNQFSPSTFFKTYGSQQAYGSQSVAWYNSSWSYRKPITIDHTKVSNIATSTYSSFPVLISVTDPNLKTISNGGLVASSTGGDILFTDSNGTSLLNYEIESYASSTGNLIAWVRIPTLTASSDYTIYEYFGNASAAVETTSNIQNTWDINYGGVYHLPNGTALSANDSTSNGNNGTITSVTATTGKIGGAASFNGTSASIVLDNALSLQSATGTMSAWINTTNAGTTYRGILVKQNAYGFFMNANEFGIYDWVSANWRGSGYSPNDGNWHYLVCTYQSGVTNGTLCYADGQLKLTTTMTINAQTNPMDIGEGGFNGQLFTGTIDEARFSTSVRSADWIKTEYNNQSSPSTFYAYGALQAQARAAATPAEGLVNRGAGISWYNSSWSYRKPITIDHTKISSVATSTYSSFPLLVSVTDSQLKTVANGGLVASSTGADIIFTDSNGTSLLNYEIESYASSTGNLVAWVSIPLLTATSDYTIYEYFGNSSAPAETTSNIQNTWDSNYKGIWHLPNGTTLTANDSTSNANNGTLQNTPTATAGQIAGGASFTAASSQYITTANTLNIATPTVSAWVKIPANPGTGFVGSVVGIVQGNQSGTNDKDIYINPNGTVSWYVYYASMSAPELATSVGTLSPNVWHYLVGTADGTTSRLYIDGRADGSIASGNTYTSYSAPGFEINGEYGTSGSYGTYMTDTVDEARISSIARSADWIQTEYNNQSSPSTFYAYGALGANGRQTPAGAPAPSLKVRGGVKFR